MKNECYETFNGVRLPIRISGISKEDDLGYFDPNDDLEQYISDWLSDFTGYCHLGFQYLDNGDTVKVYDVNWDTSE